MKEKPTKKQEKMIQYCIDGVLLEEVLSSVPSGVRINKLFFEIGHPLGKLRVEPNAELKALGVKYIRKPSGQEEITGCFELLSKTKMISNVKEICKHMGLPVSQARVASLHLEYDGIKAYFKRIRKEIRPDATDQRKKLTVLGMETYEGEGISNLLQVMSLSKYTCTFEPVIGTRIMCIRA